MLAWHHDHGQAPAVQQDILQLINGCFVARGHTQGAVLLRLPPFFSGGLFFTGVVCEHSFVAKELSS